MSFSNAPDLGLCGSEWLGCGQVRFDGSTADGSGYVNVRRMTPSVVLSWAYLVLTFRWQGDSNDNTPVRTLVQVGTHFGIRCSWLGSVGRHLLRVYFATNLPPGRDGGCCVGITTYPPPIIYSICNHPFLCRHNGRLMVFW